MSDTQQPTWIGKTIGGRYYIKELLGRGGMSSVYKAEDPNLQRTVAVKIIHPHLSENPEFVKRFEQEAAAVAKLRHPNIMQVHDFNHDNGVYYIIFEYIPGQPLDIKLKTLKDAGIKMPIQDAVGLMIPLCEAVAYAHGRQMIHRDLKPSNVIIDLLNQPILLDFGIAKIIGGDHVHTATGATIGTAAYMAPEQVLGEEINHQADIYSLGILLYEMAAGSPPYEGNSPLTVMMKHVNDPLPDIRLANTNLPTSFAAVLQRALAKQPEDRFESAMEMAIALREVDHQLLAPSSTQSFIGRPIERKTSPTQAKGAIETPPPTQSTPQTPVSTPPANTTPTPTARKTKPMLLYGGIAVVVLLLLAAAGYFLTRGGDTAVATSAGMSQIPAGTYTVGTDLSGSNYAPEQQVVLAAFWLDRQEVTNIQYADYLASHEGETPATWTGNMPPNGAENHPVQGITWQMAADYCTAQGKRLPTETEWEVAARGDLGLLYPWGSSANAVPLPSTDTYPVGSNPANRSPFGIYDMTGNVWEWVDEPYTAVSGRDKVLRGGAYDFLKDMAYRLHGDPNIPTMFKSAGIRCAATDVEIVADDDILVLDDFTDETSGWPIMEEGSVLSGYHPPDYYHVQSGQPNQIATAYFGGDFQNIGLETNVFVDSTDTETGDFRYGLITRRNGDQFYAFTVSPRAGIWQVLKASPDGLQKMDEGTIDTLSNSTDHPDRLRVDASGNKFLFSINGELITVLHDASYSSGDIGFYVETFDESRAHVHYDLVQAQVIDELPETAVLLSDDFTDPGSGWPIIDDNVTLSGYHPPDYYHVQSGTANHRSTAFLPRRFRDYTVEANVFVDSTDSETGDFYYGLGVRQNEDDYYALLVSPRAGQWQVIANNAEGSTLLGSGEIALQGIGTTDRFRIDAQGDEIIFHINGRPLLGVTDVAAAEGGIGFIVETLDETRAHVHYDTLTVRDVEADMSQVENVVSATGEQQVVAEVEPTSEPEEEPAVEEPTAAPTSEPTPTGPRPSSIGMVKVDAGDYLVGEDTAVSLDEFWIDRTEVTYADFANFADVAEGLEDHPVQGVDFDTAVAYCESIDKRLPTETEWEVAARGPQAFLYPWGNDASLVTLPNSDTYAVGTLPQNRSYFGTYDMAGNVWEWVSEPFNSVGEGEQIIRGGANNFQKNMVEFVAGEPTNTLMTSNTGFRCAASFVNEEPDSEAILYDDFSDIESGWFNARAPVGPYFYGYHPTDFYHVQVEEANSCLNVFRELPTDNFTAEAQIFIADTDTETGDFRYGLIARENGNEFYAFTVSPRTQTWKVLKSSNAGLGLMDEGTAVSISGIDQENRDRLAVAGNGSELSFFVNGELVSKVNDSEYTEGNVGFIVETMDETYAHIHYDTIEVRPLTTSNPATTNGSGSYPNDSPLCQGTVSAEDSLDRFTTHSVITGETLNAIAQRYNVTQEAILAANGKAIDNPNVIRPGQTIIIPES